MNRRDFFYFVTGVTVSSFLTLFSACSPPNTKHYFNVYKAKKLNAPEIVYCFSTIGHKKGTTPFIMGGTCCCSPTQELMDQYHEDGILLNYDLAKLIAEYKERGIVLEHENGWQCNNQCAQGPHIVFDGKCMVSPTLGTQNWENVITGKKPIH